jgi:HEAT repeat protein
MPGRRGDGDRAASGSRRHLDDPRALAALAAALDDPVPRVRRNAGHALGCVACKPSWDGSLPGGAAAKLRQLAAADPNPKVRAEAQRTLGRLGLAADGSPRRPASSRH